MTLHTEPSDAIDPAPLADAASLRVAAMAGHAGVRVGNDLVRVSQVVESIARFGDAYLRRIFTPSEIAYCTSRGEEAFACFAARFAAKEATMKVLRPSKDEALDWRSIEVVRAAGGWCEIAVTGAAKALARRGNICGFAVSLSHEADHATAVVVAQQYPRARRTSRIRRGFGRGADGR